MLERRRHSRGRAFAAGTIAPASLAASAPDLAAVDCVVRNTSAGGALLLLDEPCRAPIEMVLATRGDLRPARVVWRGEAAVGVAFLAAAPAMALAPAPSPASVRPATVVDLDAVRRRTAPDFDEGRLARRIVRFVAPRREPGSN